MSALIYNLAGLPTDLASIPLFLLLIEPRNRRGFSLFVACSYVVLRFARGLIGDGFGLLILPVLLWACVHYGSGTLTRRVLGFVLGIAFINVLMMPPTMLWVSLYGFGPQEVADRVLEYPSYFAFQLLIAMYTLLSLQVLRVIVGYVRKNAPSRIDVSGLLLLAVQTLWFVPLYLSDWTFHTASVPELMVMTTCHVVAFASSMLFARDALSAVTAQEDKARAEVLVEAARGYERHYREVEQAIDRVATLRHDLRNQLQVVDGLVARGETDAAQRLLDGLLDGGGGRLGDEESETCVRVEIAAEEHEEPGGKPQASRWGNLWLVVYPANVALCIYLSYMGLSRADISTVGKVLFVCVVVVWAALTPYLVRVVRQAREAEMARVRVRAAQEMVDARVWYGERIVAELGQARELEAALLARVRSVRDALAAGEEPDGALAAGGPALRKPWCENRALDTLIALKAATCEAEGIRLVCELDVPAGLKLSDLELCTLFSNVLDNAIEAARGLPEGRRWVDLVAEVRAGWLVVVARNSCAGGGEAGPVAGSLSDEHGWGLRILSKLARSHGGELETEAEDGTFTCRVTAEA